MRNSNYPDHFFKISESENKHWWDILRFVDKHFSRKKFYDKI